MIFETERLTVRLLTPEDLIPFHEMQGNKNVMRYTDSPAKSFEEDKKDLEEVIALYSTRDNDFWVWAIERKSDQAYIGTCAFVKSEPDETGNMEDEIGFRFLEKYWRNGYGKEILPALLYHGFSAMGIKEIIAEVDERNIGSIKIIERCMNFERSYFNEKDQCTDRLYRIKRSEFKNLQR